MDQKKNKKIDCKVENCAYHGQDNCCCARQISVGPQSACCSQDTVCATFKPEGGTHASDSIF